MPRPQPFYRRWMKDPKKRERFFKYYWIVMVAVQLLLVAGFIMFIILLWKQNV